MKMKLDESESTTIDGQNELIRFGDVASEVQAHTSQLIIEKYRSLIAMESTIADMKRDFNDMTLKLRALQEDLCERLLAKVQQIKENDCSNIDIEACISYKQHQFFEFDGNRFLPKTLTIPIFNVGEIKCKESTLAENDNGTLQMNWNIAKSKLLKAIELNGIERIYREFDVQIKSLSHKYNEVQLKLKLMELHCLTLYQELLIIDQFEEPEKALLETIAALSMQMMRVEDEIKCSKMKLKCLMESDEFPELSMCRNNSTEIKRFLDSNGI